MQEQAINQYSPDETHLFINQIPFLNDLFETDKPQFEMMMSHTKVQTFETGEVILIKGSHDNNFYSLIKGKVDVFAEIEPGKKAISQLSQGQILGALSIINGEPRTATLAASNDEGATLIATDFSGMGELDDYSQISMSTKISFYNTVVNNIRWKLEVYKRNTTDPTLAQELKLLTPFAGRKGTFAELQHLGEHAEQLGCLLDSWNDVVEPDIELPKRIAPKGEKKGLFSSIFGAKK